MMEGDARLPVVLVIEDDRAARQLYVLMLQESGCRVVEAHNGLQAMEKAGYLLPDAIVTDLGLPGIDGFEVCRRLQADERTRQIPVVAVTGRYVSAADVARARRQGCSTVLIKPFVPDDLVGAVKAILDTGCSSSTSV
jgi:two-component system, cell cycle response regulator DivK